MCHDCPVGLLRSYLKQFQYKPRPKRYWGEVRNASGQVIWRCDCNHRSVTAATRCGRREAAWLASHPEQMAQLKPRSWRSR
jgi:hypothetical protein